jgi:CPA1 family monovalent cation:H+ antiporter
MLWVFPLSAVAQRRGGARRPSWPVPAVVSWAGTRGVVPLAAALSIPLTDAAGAPLSHRDLILVLAIAAIVISLIVQGLTLGPLVRLAGIAQPGDARQEEATARLRLAQAALARLDELAEEATAVGDTSTGDTSAADASAADASVADDAIDRARATLQARIDRARARVDDSRAGDRQAPEPGRLTDRELRRALNAAEHAELARLYDEAAISQATRQSLQRSLDLEATRLGDDHH